MNSRGIKYTRIAALLAAIFSGAVLGNDGWRGSESGGMVWFALFGLSVFWACKGTADIFSGRAVVILILPAAAIIVSTLSSRPFEKWVDGLPFILLCMISFLSQYFIPIRKISWQKIAPGMIILGWILCLCWRIVHINFGLVDDHEYHYLMGSNQSLTARDVFSWYVRLEPGNYGNTFRYRPIYYALRLFEVWAFRDSASLYLLARVLMVWIFCMGVYRIARLWFPRAYSIMVSAAVLGLPAWTQIWFDLGAAEVYAVTVLPWIVFSIIRWLYMNAWGEQPKSKDVWIAACLSVLAIGIKENFIFLTALQILLMMVSMRVASQRWQSTFASLMTVSMTALIVCAVEPMMRKTGMDQIGRPSGIGVKIHWGILWLQSSLGLLFALTLVLFIFNYMRGYSPLQRALLCWLSAVSIPLVLSGSQYVLYSGEVPSANRYNYPYILAMPLFVLVIISLFFWLSRSNKSAQRVIVTLGVIIIVVMGSLGDWRQYKMGIEGRRSYTYQVSQTLATAATLARAQPSADVWVVMSNTADYEAAVAALRYFKFACVTNPIYLSRDSAASTSAIFESLQEGGYGFSKPDRNSGSISDVSMLSSPARSRGAVIYRPVERSVFFSPGSDPYAIECHATWSEYCPGEGDVHVITFDRPLDLVYRSPQESTRILCIPCTSAVGGDRLRIKKISSLDPHIIELNQYLSSIGKCYMVPVNFSTGDNRFQISSALMGSTIRIKAPVVQIQSGLIMTVDGGIGGYEDPGVAFEVWVGEGPLRIVVISAEASDAEINAEFNHPGPLLSDSVARRFDVLVNGISQQAISLQIPCSFHMKVHLKAGFNEIIMLPFNKVEIVPSGPDPRHVTSRTRNWTITAEE